MHPTEINARLGVIMDVLRQDAANPAPKVPHLTPGEMKRNALAKAKVFHNTVHVYGNDDYRHHCVPDFELEGMLEYNTTMRFGRAIFVDGKCVWEGYLDAERIAQWEEKIRGWPMPELSYPRN